MSFIALLLAVASATPAVRVAPADVTAAFQGDGTALKLDPSCRDYTVETVRSNPECAARVANGEAGPSIGIAAHTVMSDPSKGAEAIDILANSIRVTDSPAVHYLLGSIVGNAERVRPDYARAVQHLGIAADRGNPAAADLLATLLIKGKGAPRDVPRAIRLYEKAAAGGWPSAARALGVLYLAGKYVPRDEQRGRAWLDAAAAVDTPGAAQLASMASNQDKISNFQLIPAVDPAKVKAVRFGTFDNPPIPPSFGFDPEFETVYDTPYDDQGALNRLQQGVPTLPTPYLYELSRRLAARDPDGSLRTYLLARMRMTYDASRCADPAALEALQA